MSLQFLLWILWGAVTLCFVIVMAWKALAGMKEEHDIVVLDDVEQAHAADVQATIVKMQRLTSWAKGFGLASLALLVLAGGVWVYHGVQAVASSQIR